MNTTPKPETCLVHQVPKPCAACAFVAREVTVPRVRGKRDEKPAPKRETKT